MKATTQNTLVLIAATVALLLGNVQTYPQSRELRKEGSLKQHKTIQNYFHSYIKNDIVVKVRILKYWFPGQESKSVWYKRVTEGGKKPVTYTKRSPNQAWTLLPMRSVIPALDKQKKMKQARNECQEGWEIGKAVARTITYFALNQDKLRSLLGTSARNAGKAKYGAVDLKKVGDQIKAVIERTALCIRERLMADSSSMKEKCIHKAVMKEAKILIEKIKEKAHKNGFICSYAALKEDECQLSKLDEIIELKEYA